MIEDEWVIADDPNVKMQPYSTMDSKDPPHEGGSYIYPLKRKMSHHLVPCGASTFDHIIN